MTIAIRPLYIFDLDGTLALIEHRKHYIEDKPANWKGFYRACVDDKPNTPVIRTMHALMLTGAEVLIFSGRSDEVRRETEAWLEKHTNFPVHLPGALMMRSEGDYTPDDELKRHWLRDMLVSDRERIVAVFDDRDKVVEMWRAEGVPCFQVARGEF